MLSSEFNQRMGALIRSLESSVLQHPNLHYAGEAEAKDALRDAIVALVAVYLSME